MVESGTRGRILSFLFPPSFSLLPLSSPCSLIPVPCFLFPVSVPCFLLPASCSLFPASLFPAPSVPCFPAPCFPFPAPSSPLSVPCSLLLCPPPNRFPKSHHGQKAVRVGDGERNQIEGLPLLGICLMDHAGRRALIE